MIFKTSSLRNTQFGKLGLPLVFCALPCVASSQNFSQNLPGAPSGFSHPTDNIRNVRAPLANPEPSAPPPAILMTNEEGAILAEEGLLTEQPGLMTEPGVVLDPGATDPGFMEQVDLAPVIKSLSIQTTLSASYNSNVTQGNSDSPDEPEASAFILGLGGTVSYHGGGSEWTYGANYHLNYDQYFGDRSDLSGFNQQSGDVFLDHNVGKIGLSGRAGFAISDGANRFYGDVVKEYAYYYGFDGSYELSPKTSLTGSVTQRFTDTNSEDKANTSSLDFNLAAMWKLSSITRIGPGVRYSLRTGDSQGDRNSFGPTINVSYELTSKISFNSVVGLEFVDYESGASVDPDVTASMALDYRASELWGLNASLHRNTRADPSTEGSYDLVTAFNLTYYRNIRRTVFRIGAGYETSQSESDGSSTSASGSRSDREYLTLDCSLSMGLFAERVKTAVFVKYQDQKSDNLRDDWDGYQVGISFSHDF